MLRAIDYAHIHGRQVYLTVNTLFKEEELEQGLYEYLLPYYEQGLDAVIVQDMGRLQGYEAVPQGWISHQHADDCDRRGGCGVHEAARCEPGGHGAEMSFAEIREIHDKVGIEIESFVHGALCYCYSGQCLLSSMLGGRKRQPWALCTAVPASL